MKKEGSEVGDSMPSRALEYPFTMYLNKWLILDFEFQILLIGFVVWNGKLFLTTKAHDSQLGKSILGHKLLLRNF